MNESNPRAVTRRRRSLLRCHARVCESVGCTLLDTAQIYKSAILLICPCCVCCGGTYSESLLSEPVNTLGRNKFTVATKVESVKGKSWGAKKWIKDTCDDSLDRLGVQCIDLYVVRPLPKRRRSARKDS